MEKDPLAELRNRLYALFVSRGGAIKLNALTGNRFHRALVIARMGNLPDAYELLKDDEEKRPFVPRNLIDELIVSLRLYLKGTEEWPKLRNMSGLELVLEKGYEDIARDMVYGTSVEYRYKPLLTIYRHTKDPKDLWQARKYRKHAHWVGYDGRLNMLVYFASQTGSSDDWLMAESFVEKNQSKLSSLALTKYWCSLYQRDKNKQSLERAKSLATTAEINEQEEAPAMWRAIAKTTRNPRHYWRAKRISNRLEEKRLKKTEEMSIDDLVRSGEWPHTTEEWAKYAEYLLSQESPDMEMVIETFQALFAND